VAELGRSIGCICLFGILVCFHEAEWLNSLVLELQDGSVCSSLLFSVFKSTLPLFVTFEKRLAEFQLY